MKKLFRKLSSKRKKGFTLFEVLIVVIILGVLAVMAVPTYQKVIRKSRVADGLNVLDMLAGAQDKYFIENGQYAHNITELNAPFKEYRTGEHNDIYTTNFTYDNPENKTCLRAVANIGGDYTLVKNYKDKTKTFCIGADCNMVSDYVDELPSAFGDFCPDQEALQCNLTDEICAPRVVISPESPDCYCECPNLAAQQASCEAQTNHVYNTGTCECVCSQSSITECSTIGGTYNYGTCSCIPPGGSGCLDTIPDDIIEKCDEGDPTKCGTKTTHYICDETTGWHVQAVVSDCENVTTLSGTTNCDAEGWKHGCGIKSVQGVCELNAEGTQYQWNITGYGSCHYADPSFDCGKPGWQSQLGSNEVCRYCHKQQCTGDYPVALQDKGNCLRADTTWNGYITGKKQNSAPSQNTKQCHSCDEYPIYRDPTKCPVEQRCTNAYGTTGESVSCQAYSTDADLVQLCKTSIGYCPANGTCHNKRVVYKNVEITNCYKPMPGGGDMQHWYQFETSRFPVLRCIKRWQNDG